MNLGIGFTIIDSLGGMGINYMLLIASYIVWIKKIIIDEDN